MAQMCPSGPVLSQFEPICHITHANVVKLIRAKPTSGGAGILPPFNPFPGRSGLPLPANFADYGTKLLNEGAFPPLIVVWGSVHPIPNLTNEAGFVPSFVCYPGWGGVPPTPILTWLHPLGCETDE